MKSWLEPGVMAARLVLRLVEDERGAAGTLAAEALLLFLTLEGTLIPVRRSEVPRVPGAADLFAEPAGREMLPEVLWEALLECETLLLEELRLWLVWLGLLERLALLEELRLWLE